MEGLNFEKMSEIFNDISVFPFKALFDTRVDKMSAVYYTNVNIGNLHDYNKSVIATFLTLLKIESVK